MTRPIAQRRSTRRHALGTLAGSVLGLALAGCVGKPSGSTGMAQSSVERLVARPDRDEWPAIFWQSGPPAQEAYRWAVENSDTLRYIPCYCGCVQSGHTSNLDCYVEKFGEPTVTLDVHGFG